MKLLTVTEVRTKEEAIEFRANKTLFSIMTNTILEIPYIFINISLGIIVNVCLPGQHSPTQSNKSKSTKYSNNET
jgi:hypothetical protein